MAKLELKASEAIEEVRKLRAGIKSLKEEAKNSDGAEALVNRLDKMQKMAELNIHKFKTLDAAISKSKDEAKKAVGPYDKLIKKFRESDKAAKDAAVQFGVYSKQANAARSKTALLAKEINKIDKAAKPLKTRFSGINKVLGSLAGFVGFYVIAQQAIALAKSTFELTKRLNAFNFAMEAVLADEQELITTRSFLREITEAYGAELISTTNRYIKFRTAAKEAGMSMADTQKIFATMTKAAGVLGLQTDELTGIYLALEQMISKGKITTEELRRQLGERLPGAMDIMAKSMGVSTAELDKMMKKGEVISKDVLPRFAEEVERAFGLESVTKVETLAAAEVRLGNAWTNLINAIESGEGRISKPLMKFFADLADVLNQLETLNRTDTDWIDIAQADGYAEGLEAINEEFRLYKDNFPDEEFTIKDIAIANLSKYGEEWQKANKELAKANEQLDKLPEEKAFEGTTLEELRAKREAAALSAKKDLAYWKGKINAAKSFFNVIDQNEGSEGSGDDVRLKSLRDVLDLEKQIQVNRLKANIEANKAIIENEETSNEKRNELLKENANKLIEIAKLEEELAVAAINSKSDKEIEALEKSFADGKVLQEDYTKQLVDLEKERGQKILIEKQKYDAKVVSSQDKLISDLTNSNEKYYKKQVEEARRPFEAKIALLSEELIAEETTAERKKELIAEIKKLRIEADNAAILSSIAILEAQAFIAESLGKNTDEIIAKINELKGKLKSIGDDIPDDEIKNKFENILLEIAEILAEIGNLFSNIFDRRIEDIEALMHKEEQQYDASLKLARDDVSKKEALEQQRDDRIKELEKQRLKEEQKQARVKKAFALAEIAINTAIAVSKVWGQTGIFGIAAEIPVLIMGAIQTAAVLAAPIPQYKDGLDSASEDHIGMINDGVKNGKMVQEYIGRGDSILTSNKKDAIVPLKKGDTVYKDFDALNKDSLLLNTLLQGNQVNEAQFNNIFDGISNEIKDGFSKAKINNNLRIHNNIRSSEYRKSLNRWN